MISGLDVASPQRNISWDAVVGAGIQACYVKLGGDNVGRYVAPYYVQQVDASHAYGLVTGHYWVPGGDPTSAADFFTSNLRGVTDRDFFVLDNETLDDGRMYGDDEAATFLRRVGSNLGIGVERLFLYSGAADLRGRGWPQCEALGVRVIVASYGGNNGSRDHEPNMGGAFGNVWAGHQYTSQGNIGGVTVDLNTFQDWAFTYNSSGGGSQVDTALVRRRQEEDMYIHGSGQPQWVYATYTDPNGKLRMRFCDVNETAFALAGGLIINGDDPTLEGIAKEAGYAFGSPNPLPTVQVKGS